jgi:hypothetical protein
MRCGRGSGLLGFVVWRASFRTELIRNVFIPVTRQRLGAVCNYLSTSDL